MTMTYLATDVEVWRLTPELAHLYNRRLFACYTLEQLIEVGKEIAMIYAADDARRRENAAALATLRTTYKVCHAVLERSDPR